MVINYTFCGSDDIFAQDDRYTQNKTGLQSVSRLVKPTFITASSRGGLEVERLLHKLHDSTLVGSNPARRYKDFCSNSKSTGGALVNKICNV